MVRDVFRSMMLRDTHVVVGLATTTGVCQSAYHAHGLGSTACVALGRLLTATALAGLVQRGSSIVSMQVLGSGQLGQLFADVTPEGHLRGYVKHPHVALPLLPGEGPRVRRSVGHGLRPGSSCLIRDPGTSSFVQSSADLVSGEIDEDIEHLIEKSDQVRTAMACDVLLDEELKVVSAAGVIVQGMPDSSASALAQAQALVKSGALARHLASAGGDDEALRQLLFPGAEDLEPPRELTWRCRCSHERVLTAIRMLDLTDLAELITARESAAVRCDFCNARYEVTLGEIERIHDELSRPAN